MLGDQLEDVIVPTLVEGVSPTPDPEGPALCKRHLRSEISTRCQPDASMFPHSAMGDPKAVPPLLGCCLATNCDVMMY
jgi:hypothetical protein